MRVTPAGMLDRGHCDRQGRSSGAGRRLPPSNS